jgi:excisionase family DNA binding protein
MTFDEKGERLYTTAEAGEILGIRSRSVVELIRIGRITSAKRVGRMHYIAQSEVERYQRERQIPGFSWRKPKAESISTGGQSDDSAQDNTTKTG